MTTSEDFERFVKEHREEILRILEVEDKPKSQAEEIRDNFTKAASDFMKVLADNEVQKHFFNGCMEFVMCMEAAIRSMPLPDDLRDVADQAEKARDNAVKNAAKTTAKNTAKAKLEKINVTSRLKKTDAKTDE